MGAASLPAWAAGNCAGYLGTGHWDTFAEAQVDGSETHGAKASVSGHHNCSPVEPGNSALRGAVEVPRKTSMVPVGQP